MYEIVGMDIASKDSEDFSTISAMCDNCKHVIHSETFTGDSPTNKCPKECPNCGAKFKSTIVLR